MHPAGGEKLPLAQADAAPQREPVVRSNGDRRRGPHPLPIFLETVARACGDDRARLADVLAGLRRYQDAPVTVGRAARPVVGRVGGVMLRDFGGAGPLVVMVPSLINPPTVLDLAAGNSLLDGLAAHGLRVLAIDWGPTEALDLAALVTERLVPLVAGVGEPAALAGYCLGGTLAVAAAALLGPQVTRLALLATPWHFSAYHGALADWWASAGPLAAQLGVLPIELLQPAFWSLDPDGLAAKYARLATAPEAGVTAFAALEDWSNGGQPLALAAARSLAEALFRDNLPGRGAWPVGGQRIDAAAMTLPILDVIAARDRIVPAAAALTTAGPGLPLALDAGHVGMVVGSRAPALLWDPLAAWLRT